MFIWTDHITILQLFYERIHKPGLQLLYLKRNTNHLRYVEESLVGNLLKSDHYSFYDKNKFLRRTRKRGFHL